MFAVFPFLMRFHRWFYWLKNEIIFYVLFDARPSILQNLVKKKFIRHIQSVVKDPDMASKLTPSYNIGCKRITPSDVYLQVRTRTYIHTTYV